MQQRQETDAFREHPCEWAIDILHRQPERLQHIDQNTQAKVTVALVGIRMNHQ